MESDSKYSTEAYPGHPTDKLSQILLGSLIGGGIGVCLIILMVSCFVRGYRRRHDPKTEIEPQVLQVESPKSDDDSTIEVPPLTRLSVMRDPNPFDDFFIQSSKENKHSSSIYDIESITTTPYREYQRRISEKH